MGSPLSFTEVLPLPNWSPCFLGFLWTDFLDAVCFTSEPNLSSPPKLSWSLKKRVFSPLFFYFFRMEKVECFHSCASYVCICVCPWGQKPLCFTGFYFGSSCLLFLFFPSLLYSDHMWVIFLFSLSCYVKRLRQPVNKAKCLTLYKFAHLRCFLSGNDILCPDYSKFKGIKRAYTHSFLHLNDQINTLRVFPVEMIPDWEWGDEWSSYLYFLSEYKLNISSKIARVISLFI